MPARPSTPHDATPRDLLDDCEIPVVALARELGIKPSSVRQVLDHAGDHTSVGSLRRLLRVMGYEIELIAWRADPPEAVRLVLPGRDGETRVKEREENPFAAVESKNRHGRRK